MSYIGNTPAESFISFERQVFTIVNSQTAYTLSHSVTNENDIRLVVNNVVQEPGSGKAYTASGTTLTLSAALVNGTDEMYCVFLGRALQTVNPPNASVGSAQIADSLISGKTALGATPADTDELLISDAGTLKKVDYSHLKSSNTPAFVVYLSGDQNNSHNAWTKVSWNSELYDTDSAFASNKFTIPSGKGGTYKFETQINTNDGQAKMYLIKIALYKNGSSFAESRFRWEMDGANHSYYQMPMYCSFIDSDADAADYYEIYTWAQTSDSGGYTLNGGTPYQNFFQGFKLIT